MIKEQHLRNINLVGSSDPNVLADFNTNLGQRYQLALAKLANYKTTIDASFLTGMNVTLLSSNATQAISSITSSSLTATVTTTSAHGLSTANVVAISGASPAGYNGTYSITVTGSTTFTYTLTTAQATSASVSQFYPFPQGEVTVEGMFITMGSVNYPLQIINSRWNWEQLNAIQIQASAIPQFYFPRQYDFGIWPTPQASYQGTISYHYRDRNLSVADYTNGSVTVTQNSQIVVGSLGATFTTAMVGRWFTITSPTVPGQGYWFLLTEYIDSTHMKMNQVWTQATATTSSYIIGETPDVPEELHSIFAWGTASDYYGGMQKDTENATLYDNMFWTGNAANPSRKQGDSSITGGLLGGIDRYSDRDDRRLIKRKPKLSPLQYKVFATTLS